MIPTYLANGCQHPIEHCAVSEENYLNDGS